jgi:superoxide reductase
VPAIECPDKVKPGESFHVKVIVGKEIAHPNTTEHHISWISIYFHATGEKFPYETGHFEFSAHGESGAGPNQGPVYANPEVTVTLKITKPGVIYAASLCNLHGLWQSAKEIQVA